MEGAMRVVLAHDLSGEADRALAVIASQPWPSGTVVRVVTSPRGLVADPSSFDRANQHLTHAQRLRSAIEMAHMAVATMLRERGISVETAIVPGAPAKAVVADARDFGADLIVVGSRGRDALTTTLLGSVSTEIAKHAPCSTLVVRVESLRRVLLATDGSPAALAATGAIAAWRFFALSRVRVVAVAPPPSSYTQIALSPAPTDQVANLGAATSAAERHARVVANLLSAAGHDVEIEVRSGQPASEIIAAAREWPADVVVVGSRGSSLLRRLLLGSVARSVWHGVHASVLVVRGTLDPVAHEGGAKAER
jgi:nucleotide-binding universal stress UspA family protein